MLPLESFVKFCLKDENTDDLKLKRNVLSFIKVWMSTTIIMWLYVAFSYTVFDFPLVGHIGLICTILHTISPLIYKYTKSLVLSGFNISMTGLIFQLTFCLFNGGITSPSAIWFTLHPVIMSFFGSRKLIILSVVINTLLVIGLAILGNYGYFSTNYLDNNLTQVMMITSFIGLDILIAVYTIVFISQSKKSEKLLEGRNELIENLMRIISHDINNSLNVSMLATRSLRKNINDEKLSKKIDLILKSNDQINQITKSVRDWMKSNTEGINLELRKVKICDVINYVKDSFNDLLKSKNISLEVIDDCKPHNLINVDLDALRFQVINNIMTNAIKFTASGGVINFDASIEGRYVNFKLTDEGIGMPASLIKDIFNPLKSSSREGTSGEKGTGFGMPIVKTILNNMNGQIDISSVEQNDSNEKTGTTVVISLPVLP